MRVSSPLPFTAEPRAAATLPVVGEAMTSTFSYAARAPHDPMAARVGGEIFRGVIVMPTAMPR